MDVFAIQRRDKRAIQPIDDRPGQAVTGVLRLLDEVGLGHVRRVGREDLLERSRALAGVFPELHEVLEELFVAWNETEAHVTSAHRRIVPRRQAVTYIVRGAGSH